MGNRTYSFDPILQDSDYVKEPSEAHGALVSMFENGRGVLSSVIPYASPKE